MRAPIRQQKGDFMKSTKTAPRPDVFTAPDLIGDANAEGIFAALQPLDQIAVLMDEKWGADKLLRLVSVETAARFGAAKAKLDQAIAGNNSDDVARRASVMVRGWQAMDREASAAGAKPISVDAWCWRDDLDQAHAFVRDAAESVAYSKQHPGVAVWSMAEVVRLAETFNDEMRNLGSKVKVLFPGATLSVRNREPLDGEIPF